MATSRRICFCKAPLNTVVLKCGCHCAVCENWKHECTCPAEPKKCGCVECYVLELEVKPAGCKRCHLCITHCKCPEPKSPSCEECHSPGYCIFWGCKSNRSPEPERPTKTNDKCPGCHGVGRVEQADGFWVGCPGCITSDPEPPRTSKIPEPERVSDAILEHLIDFNKETHGDTYAVKLFQELKRRRADEWKD